MICQTVRETSHGLGTFRTFDSHQDRIGIEWVDDTLHFPARSHILLVRFLSMKHAGAVTSELFGLSWPTFLSVNWPWPYVILLFVGSNHRTYRGLE